MIIVALLRYFHPAYLSHRDAVKKTLGIFNFSLCGGKLQQLVRGRAAGCSSPRSKKTSPLTQKLSV